MSEPRLQCYLDSREPEALTLLAALSAARTDTEVIELLGRARRYLVSVRRREGMPAIGHPCKLSDDTLRRIAALRAQGFTQAGIAYRMGLHRALVAHHLKPSKAMRAACASL